MARLIALMDNYGLPLCKSVNDGFTSGPTGFISNSNVVLLKINSQWD